MNEPTNSTTRTPRKYARHEVVTCPPPMKRDHTLFGGKVLMRRTNSQKTELYMLWYSEELPPLNIPPNELTDLLNQWSHLFNNYESRLLAHRWSITDIRWFHQQTGGQWFATNAKAYYRSRALVEVFQSTGGVFFISSASVPDTGRRVYEVYQFLPLTGEIIPRKEGTTKHRARKAARELSEGIAPTNEGSETTTPNSV